MYFALGAKIAVTILLYIGVTTSYVGLGARTFFFGGKAVSWICVGSRVFLGEDCEYMLSRNAVRVIVF